MGTILLGILRLVGTYIGTEDGIHVLLKAMLIFNTVLIWACNLGRSSAISIIPKLVQKRYRFYSVLCMYPSRSVLENPDHVLTSYEKVPQKRGFSVFEGPIITTVSK
jgi:hypothetical protein